MTDLQLYQQLLGLSAPWAVQRVEVDREHTEVPRIQGPSHGVRSVAVPWAGPGSRFTQAFACFAVAVLRATQQQTQTAALLHLSVDEVAGLMERPGASGLARREAAGRAGAAEVPETLTLDEKQWVPGQEYLTVLGDPEGQRVWEVTAGREGAAGVDLLETCLDPAQRDGVRTVALDLWAGFSHACQEVLPQARLAQDRFHAVQALNRAVDQTRREEHQRFPHDGSVLAASD